MLQVLLSLFLLAAPSIPHPEYPRPQLVRERWMSLNGQWDLGEETIMVPFPAGSPLSGASLPGQFDTLHYSRRFKVPASWKKDRVILNFGAVDWGAEVFVNGHRAGGHTGGYSPWSLDITPFLNRRGTESLEVKVWDPTDSNDCIPHGKQAYNTPGGIWYTPVCGIWQSVWLEPVKDARVEGYHADTDLRSLTVYVNTTGVLADDTIEVSLLEGRCGYDTEKPSGKVLETVRAEDGEAVFTIPSWHLWTPEDPYLYGLRFRIVRNRKVIDSAHGYAAVRTISVVTAPDGFKRIGLNGKPLFNMGTLDQGWWPEGLYTAPSDQAMLEDIRFQKDLGFNMIRKHIKVEPARWYTYCDRLGMLVWQDMPSISAGGGVWNPDGFDIGKDAHYPLSVRENYYKELHEMIDWVRCFGCVVMWIPFNEGWGQFQTAEVTRHIKARDPSRLVNPASGGNYYKGLGDVLDCHNYPAPYMRLWDYDKINVLGEYGGIGCPVEGHLWETEKRHWGYVQTADTEVLTSRFEEYSAMLEDLVRSGLSAAVYTQTSDVESEINGLKTYDREVLKVDANRVREANDRVIKSLDFSAWPVSGPEAKAGVRWWWHGSAVDEENISWNLEQFASAGIGKVEITPIYGVKDNESNDVDFLSPRWMELLRFTEEEGERLGIAVDMDCGTGWPFGGPWIDLEHACRRAVVKDGAVVGSEPVGMMVKRAAPGGEGLVLDHFDRESVKLHLDRIEKAFEESGVPYPNAFFNDSYEVFSADWTPSLPEEFLRRRGYRIEDHYPELLSAVPDTSGVLHDYRKTLSELLEENFTRQWADWAHSHGIKVRNQAHGGPGNLLDLYAAVDIPETEGFGLTDFGIKGLRKDLPGMTRRNDADFTTLKYASSAAHVTGKPLTSCETFTWLTEHFRTSLSQMKPDLDLLFTCGINHVMIHGAAYSPKDEPWPGRQFYASVDMSPTNSIWRDAPYLFRYIEQCQRFLQWGAPDADILLYLPVDDLWNTHDGQLLMMFDIHSLAARTPGFVNAVREIDGLGLDCDYVSEKQLLSCVADNGELKTEGGARYKALVVPGSGDLSAALKAHLDSLSRLGVKIVRSACDLAGAVAPEPMRTRLGLRAIRRSHPGGYHYFIANLTPEDVSGNVSLAVPFQYAAFFNPLDGSARKAEVKDGKLSIYLRSGESVILSTSNSPFDFPDSRSAVPVDTLCISGNSWTLSFGRQGQSAFNLDGIGTWEALAPDFMGTGVYETTVEMDSVMAARTWAIELGDVRESARVYVNGRLFGCAWAAPFCLKLGKAFHEGLNRITIEVTNLPANRISAMERSGKAWKRFKDINVVDIRYAPANYRDWTPVPSGLAGPVKLVSF